MSAFEKLCNEYRENKRLIEELEAMNDSIKTDILTIMGTGRRSQRERAKRHTRRLLRPGSILPASVKCTRIYSPSTAPRQHTAVLRFNKGVKRFDFTLHFNFSVRGLR